MMVTPFCGLVSDCQSVAAWDQLCALLDLLKGLTGLVEAECFGHDRCPGSSGSTGYLPVVTQWVASQVVTVVR